MTKIDLDQVVLVNESASKEVAGSVSVFSSIEIAENYLEHWWVENREGFVTTAAGTPVEQSSDGHRATLCAVADAPKSPELSLRWLKAAAGAVQERSSRGIFRHVPYLRRSLS